MTLQTNDSAFLTAHGDNLLAGTPSPNLEHASVLTKSDIPAILDEAVSRWAAAGYKIPAGTPSVAIVDLPGLTLGQASSEQVLLDVNAAGFGWFVDATPSSDEEFTILASNGSWMATQASGAYNRIDLLSVVMHELGHVLGFEHTENKEGVMAEQLLPGTRHLLASELVDSLYATPPAQRVASLESADRRTEQTTLPPQFSSIQADRTEQRQSVLENRELTVNRLDTDQLSLRSDPRLSSEYKHALDDLLSDETFSFDKLCIRECRFSKLLGSGNSR